MVDASETLVAGFELHLTVEALFNHPVDTIVLTHSHEDYWIGTSSFDSSTCLLTREINRQICSKVMDEVLEDFKDPSWLEAEIRIAGKNWFLNKMRE